MFEQGQTFCLRLVSDFHHGMCWTYTMCVGAVCVLTIHDNPSRRKMKIMERRKNTPTATTTTKSYKNVK